MMVRMLLVLLVLLVPMLLLGCDLFGRLRRSDLIIILLSFSEFFSTPV
jgi:hypothetical protein